MRTCTRCNTAKPLDSEHFCKGNKDGFAYYCKECSKEIQRESYFKNREKILAKGREWYRSNPYNRNLSKKEREEYNAIRAAQAEETT